MNATDYYAQLKVREMVAPSMTPRNQAPSGLAGLDLGATAPRFAEVNGQTVTSIPCGIPYIFEVPGYSRVWLKLTKDGVVTFDGEFDVPMPSYTSVCGTDPGYYVAEVFDLASGAPIGTAFLTITAEGGGLFGLSPTMLLIGGGALLFLMSRRGR